MYNSEDRRKLDELESRYITLTINKDLKYSNQLPLDTANVLYILLEKLCRLGGNR
jgi:hypothetical protein